MKQEIRGLKQEEVWRLSFQSVVGVYHSRSQRCCKSCFSLELSKEGQIMSGNVKGPLQGLRLGLIMSGYVMGCHIWQAESRVNFMGKSITSGDPLSFLIQLVHRGSYGSHLLLRTRVNSNANPYGEAGKMLQLEGPHEAEDVQGHLGNVNCMPVAIPFG